MQLRCAIVLHDVSPEGTMATKEVMNMPSSTRKRARPTLKKNGKAVADWKKAFAERVELSLTRLGWTRAELAKRIQMAPNSISYHLNSPRRLSERFIQVISLNVPGMSGEYESYREVADAAYYKALGVAIERDPDHQRELQSKVLEILDRQAAEMRVLADLVRELHP